MPESYRTAPRPSTEKPQTSAADAWFRRASELAVWADKHLVNRRDAFGGYYLKDGATQLTTRKATDKGGGPLTVETLARHFQAKSIDAVIGLHSTFRDEAGECWSLSLGLDIDRHGEGGDPDANMRFVLEVFVLLTPLGFRVILTDSDGRGGFHVRVIFAAPVPTRAVFTFARWLIRDWESHGLEKEPETFPKQVGIPEGGYGNWMRVFGRHPKRDHWSKVWDGSRWLEGDEAIDYILATEGASEDLIPAEARPDPAAPFDLGREIERKRAQSQSADLGRRGKREKAADGTTEPGEDFNARAPWESILCPHGWVLDHESEGTGFWRRPGKNAGISATTNHNGNDNLYVFTDATVFKQSGSYTKFGAFTALEHAGEFTDATRALSQQGYGTFNTWVKVGDKWVLENRPNPCRKGVRIAKPDEGPPVEVHFGNGKPDSKTTVDPKPSANGDGRHKGNGQVTAGELIKPNESADDPHRLARLFRDMHCLHRDGSTLRYWQGEFLEWDGAYRPVMPEDLRARLASTIKDEFNRINVEAVGQWNQALSAGPDDDSAKGTEARKGAPKPRVRKVTGSLVSNVSLALGGYTHLPARTSQPAWLIDNPPFPADEVLPTRNRIIHLPGYVAGLDSIRSPTPTFFCPYSLDYDFDEDAPAPAEWFKFLVSLWGQDKDSTDALQEWMGYLLTPDTRRQKILLLIGPKRSGKGTIARVIKALIGGENVANPTLSSLGTNFGLAPLIGKPAAIITDARLSGRADIAQVVERLLSISGEDGQTIDRKHLPALTVKLPTRFMMISNELPRLTETSGALAGRLIILKLTRSFYGQEDIDLEKRILPELPGILLWAIEGWKRLQARGQFVQPTSASQLVEEMEDLASPAGMFIKERCEVAPDQEVPVKILFDAWREWCREKNREHVGDESAFGRNLRAVIPSLVTKPVKKDGVYSRVFVGVNLKVAF